MNIVFDFDKTLTQKDTTRRLFFYLAQKNKQSSWPYVMFFILYRLGIWTDHRFKSAIVKHYLQGQSVTDISALMTGFVKDLKAGFMNETVLAELRQHALAGDRIYVASANFEFLIQAFCEANRIDDYFATTLDSNNDRYTGLILGSVIKGEEKLRTLEEHFGVAGLDKLKFYGDAEDKVLFDAIKNHVQV